MEERMKILLVCTPFESPAHQVGASYPLGIASLGAVLEQEGHTCIVKDYLFQDWQKIKPEISELIKIEKFDCVCISCMTTNRIACFDLVKLSKKINPSMKVIMGSCHATIAWNQILQNFPVDFIVLGEGERTIVELLNHPERKENIRGIAYLENGKIIKTEPRPPIKNLDELPFPKHTYFRDRIEKTKRAFMITSRGCPFNCTFCSSSAYWGKWRRQRTVENVIEEIKQLKKDFPMIEKIYFNDDEFLINKEWLFSFCKEIKKFNIRWECPGRVSSVSEELIKAMKEAGCERIGFGVESGSLKILQSIKKEITPEQTIKAYEICKKYDVKAGMFLMVGLPGETKETINETIKLLKQTRNAEFRIPSIFQLFPGNQIYQEAVEKGFIDDNYWLTSKPAPFYTYEHPKKQLVRWALKIAFYHKLYRGEFWSFFFSNLKSQLKWDKLRRIFRTYLKNDN